MTNLTRRKPFSIFSIVLITIGCVGLLYLLSSLLGFIALGVVSAIAAQPIAAPEVFPRADIVYVGGKGLGFINADGSVQKTFRFQALGHSLMDGGREISLMAGDERTLITIYTGYSGAPVIGVYVAYPGEIAVNCGWNGPIQLAPDQKHILIETEQGKEEYLLTDCGTGNPPQRVLPGVSGVLSPDEQYVTEIRAGEERADFNRQSLIILRNLQTGDERMIGEGGYPAWSRDGRWLAYTGTDGIWVMENHPNASPQQLVPLERSSESVPVYDYVPIPPTISWSPDGQWLVYHVQRRTTTLLGGYDSYYSIVKTNVVTGETVELLDNAMFPYWVWPTEK